MAPSNVSSASGPELFFRAQQRWSQWATGPTRTPVAIPHGAVVESVSHSDVAEAQASASISYPGATHYRAPYVESVSDHESGYASAPTSVRHQSAEDLAAAIAVALPTSSPTSLNSGSSSDSLSGKKDELFLPATKDSDLKRRVTLPYCLRIGAEAKPPVKEKRSSDPDSTWAVQQSLAANKKAMDKEIDRLHSNQVLLDQQIDQIGSQVFDSRATLQEHSEQVDQLGATVQQHLDFDAAQRAAQAAQKVADAEERQRAAECRLALGEARSALERVAEHNLAQRVPRSAEGRVYCHPSEVRRLAMYRPAGQAVPDSPYPSLH